MEQLDRVYAETAMLAGEILLVSGAEIFRIEETIQYILAGAGCETEAVVFSTGIFINLKEQNGESYTILRRVIDRATNLDRICRVNQVSRQLYSGSLDIEEAKRSLDLIKETRLYGWLYKGLSYVLTSFFFGMVMGGRIEDCCGAAIMGGLLGAVVLSLGHFKLNAFWCNAAGAFSAGMAALIFKEYFWGGLNDNVVIVSAIMPLVPGVIFTTAVRDTLYGDYASGVARMMEAVVTALAVAAGVGASMALFHYMAGGTYI